jgi:hypothetical protein
MSFTLRPASRKKAKLRVGLSAASGFGKTYSALLLAHGITGDLSKVAVIDSENDSADLYDHLGPYNVISIHPPYSPERYIEAIKAAENAGMELIIIDSITHEWDGAGGCLEIYEKLGGRFQDWKAVTPRHQKFIDAILQSSAHVITTVRRKQEYVMGKNDKGYNTVEKGGTKEITRDGFEYELTVNFEILNDKHMTKASKDRTGLFMGFPEFIVSQETGQKLRDWADSGADPLADAVKGIREATDIDSLKHFWKRDSPLYGEAPSFVAAKDARKAELEMPTEA